MYGPGGSYALMYVAYVFFVCNVLVRLTCLCPVMMTIRTGMDAGRAFGTGCFKEHRTYDLRGLSEGEIHVSTQ